MEFLKKELGRVEDKLDMNIHVEDIPDISATDELQEAANLQTWRCTADQLLCSEGTLEAMWQNHTRIGPRHLGKRTEQLQKQAP